MAFRQYVWGQTEGIKIQCLASSEGLEVDIKARNFELPSSNSFIVLAKKNSRGRIPGYG